MNSILTMTLLAAGLAGNVFVYGQVRSDRAQLPPLVLKSGRVVVAPPVRVLVAPGPEKLIAPIRVVPHGDSVRIMRPDNMPCLVVRSVVEAMPVKVLIPRDPMPVKQ